MNVLNVFNYYIMNIIHKYITNYTAGTGILIAEGHPKDLSYLLIYLYNKFKLILEDFRKIKR